MSEMIPLADGAASRDIGRASTVWDCFRPAQPGQVPGPNISLKSSEELMRILDPEDSLFTVMGSGGTGG